MMAEKQDGNLYISHTELRNQVNGFLQYHPAPEHKWIPLTAQQVSDACHALCQKEMVVADQSASRGICYFLKDNYTHERGVADLLTALNTSQPQNCSASTVVCWAIQQYETEACLTLSREQKDAIILALTNPVSIVTGGSGTGKTTLLAALYAMIRILAPGAKIRACAPTGKAAVHLAGATGLPASTIHSLVGSKPHKINCGFLIVDEASMIDTKLFHNLSKSIRNSIRIVFCGDPDQLPCVGGGDVLNTMISSGKIPVATLNQIHRQTEESGIVRLAHQIKSGSLPLSLDLATFLFDDMMFVQLEDEDAVKKSVLDTVASFLATGTNANNIQILVTTNDWCNDLNYKLKFVLNPAVVSGNILNGYARVTGPFPMRMTTF